MHVLHAVIKNLKDSTETDWNESDDFDDWTRYANRMNHAINGASEVLKAASVQVEALEARIIALESRLGEKDALIVEIVSKIK